MVTCICLLWRRIRARGRPRPPSPAERDGLDTPASRGICCDGRGSFAASAWTPGLAWRTSSEPREVMYLGTRRSAPSATGGDTYSLVLDLLSCLSSRNQSETWLGCMVSWTTATRCSRSWFKSTSSRRVVLKAARVRAASYLRR